jgi:hypothetical protein
MKLFAICVSIIVLTVVVAAFVTVGSPGKQRAVKFDERRVSDLQLIESQVNNYWQVNSKLPQALVDLTGTKVPSDPETSQAYIYRMKSDKNYELCATFNLDSAAASTQNYPSSPVYGVENWDHGPGSYCFSRTVNTVPYPKPL